MAETSAMYVCGGALPPEYRWILPEQNYKSRALVLTEQLITEVEKRKDAEAERDQLQERLRAVREWAEGGHPTSEISRNSLAKLLSLLDGPEDIRKVAPQPQSPPRSGFGRQTHPTGTGESPKVTPSKPDA